MRGTITFVFHYQDQTQADAFIRQMVAASAAQESVRVSNVEARLRPSTSQEELAIDEERDGVRG